MVDVSLPPHGERQFHLTAVLPVLPGYASSCSSPRRLSRRDHKNGLSLRTIAHRPHSAPPLQADPRAIPSCPSPQVGVETSSQITSLPAGSQMLKDSTRSSSADTTPITQDQPHPTRTALSSSALKQQLSEQMFRQRRRDQAQWHLRALQLAAARSARLTRIAPTAHRALTQCINATDRQLFLGLWNALEDAYDDCSKSLTTTELPSDRPAIPTHAGSDSYFGELTARTQETLLDILTKLRTDPNFIVGCLASLQLKDLMKILPDNHAHRTNSSVIAGTTRPNHGLAKSLGFVIDAHIDQVVSRAYNSPLETLIFLPSGLSNSDAAEYRRMTDIWATVAADFISYVRPGRERLVSTLLDLWATMQPWPGKDRLAMWLLSTFQRGSFILDQAWRQTFRARAEGQTEHTSEEQRRIDAFATERAGSLLDLFGNTTGASVLPPGAMDFCAAVMAKLPAGSDRRHMLELIMTSWVFSTFLVDVTSFPEAHGIMCDHYLAERSISRILYDAIHRVQQTAFDVAFQWKHGRPVSQDNIDSVRAITAKFSDHRSSSSSAASASSANPIHKTPVTTTEATFVAASLNDFTCVLTALYPVQRASSLSDRDTFRSGDRSPARSMSDVSLFRAARLVDSLTELTLTDHEDLPEAHASLDLDQNDIRIRHACVELNDYDSSKELPDVEQLEIFAFNPSTNNFRLMQDELCEPTPQTSTTTPSISPEVFPQEMIDIQGSFEILLSRPGTAEDDSAQPSVEITTQVSYMLSAFRRAERECIDHSDFVAAHSWSEQITGLTHLLKDDVQLATFHRLLSTTSDRSQKESDQADAVFQACQHWIRTVKTMEWIRDYELRPVHTMNTCLRDKMWYVMDVRVSTEYETISAVATALKTMGKKERMRQTAQASLRRLKSTPTRLSILQQIKSQPQVVEMFAAKPEHGGPNKLTDEQAKKTEIWLRSNSIDNVCPGEERIHRLCLEVHRCVDLLVPEPSHYDTLLSTNLLFTRDENFKKLPGRPPQKPLFSPTRSLSSDLSSQRSYSWQPESMSSPSRPMSVRSSRERLEARSPTLTHRSSRPFWSPPASEYGSPGGSVTSVAPSITESTIRSPIHKSERTLKLDAVGTLRQRVAGFLISDLTLNLFGEGSETDKSFWSGLGGELARKHFQYRELPVMRETYSDPERDGARPKPTTLRSDFNYHNALVNLLTKFTIVSQPSSKLTCIYDIDRLMPAYVTALKRRHPEKRVGYTQFLRIDLEHKPNLAGWRHLFIQADIRPTTICRDLQYVASLVPRPLLRGTAQGRALEIAILAITTIKQELRHVMMETADSIIAYQTTNRGHGTTPSTAQQQQRDSLAFSTPSRTPPAEEVSHYSMGDAAYLLQIAAKEGEPIAQREFATFFLTNPELIELTLAPFALPTEVFREEREGKWKRDRDPTKCDPYTMCVAHHWMALSAQGGDALAQKSLQQTEEMDRLGG